jgi:hypothetical protein
MDAKERCPRIRAPLFVTFHWSDFRRFTVDANR